MTTGSACEKILAHDKRIRSAMVVSSQGEILEVVIQGRRLVPKEDIASLAGLWAIMIEGVAKQMEKYFGRSEVNSFTFEKLIIHGIPMGDKVIVITARKDLPIETVMNLKKIVED